MRCKGLPAWARTHLSQGQELRPRPPLTGVSRALRARNPQKVSERVSRGLPAAGSNQKVYTALLQCRTFLCRKKWGPQRKDFGGRYSFPCFHWVFVSTTGLESFSLRPEKFPKDFLSVVVVYAFFFSAGRLSRRLFGCSGPEGPGRLL